jgi:hypothetical protein
MPTPTKAQIIAKAQELYVQQCYRDGTPELADVNPEISELKESGLLSVAVSELLRDNATADLAGFEDFVKNVESWEKPEKPKVENFVESEDKKEIPFSVSECMDSGFYVCGTRQLGGKSNLVKHLTKRLIENGITAYVIDPSTAWLSNSPIQRVVSVPNGHGILTLNRISAVFDVSRLGYEERFAFVKNLCKALSESHLNGYPLPEIVVFEEVQTYLPNGCMRSKKYSDITDFCCIGGNYGLSFGAITQFSASVDKAVIKLAQQRFFGLTTEDNDKKYVRSFIGKDWLIEVVNLQRGQFVYQNRTTIRKFQCDKYGSPTNKGYDFSYNFPLSMVV